MTNRPLLIPPGTRSIKGLEGHRIGREGTVWKLFPGAAQERGRGARWKPLRSQMRGGHLWIMLGPKGARKSYRIAALVLAAYVGPRPIGHEPYHFPDPSPHNCRPENLRWVPRGQKIADNPPVENLPKTPAGSRHHNSRLSPRRVQLARQLYREGWGTVDIAGRLRVSQGTILNLLSGKNYRDVPDPLGPIVMRPRGAKPGGWNHQALSDPEEIATIRRKLAEGVPARLVAEHHGRSISSVYSIGRGENYRDD